MLVRSGLFKATTAAFRVLSVTNDSWSTSIEVVATYQDRKTLCNMGHSYIRAVVKKNQIRLQCSRWRNDIVLDSMSQAYIVAILCQIKEVEHRSFALAILLLLLLTTYSHANYNSIITIIERILLKCR